MIIEAAILAGATLFSGLFIGKACKNAPDTTVNNYNGDVINNTNSNNNSHNTNVDSHTDNRTDNRHNMNDKDELLKEIATLLNDREKEREIKEMLRKNEELINKYRK